MAFPLLQVDNNDNLYVRGLDSLKTMEIATILKSGLGVDDTSWLSSQTLYTNPTISQISKVLHRRLNLHGEVYEEESTRLEESRAAKLDAMVHKYTINLTQRPWTRNDFLEPTKLNIALTGSTGSLGIRLLKAALEDSSISKIYCLNRSEDAKSRQEKSFTALGLAYNPDDTSKITFITVNYGQNQLGLPSSQYNDLIDNVDIVIHNAWKVDFQPFARILRTRAYCRSTQSSRLEHPQQKAHLYHGSVPEALDTTYNAAQRMGYGESKNVAEHILAAAHKKSGVPLGILRVGQIAGPVDAQGAWNQDEWLPSLVKTSQSIHCLPDFVPDVDWIPVDTSAAIILEISHDAIADSTGSARVYNLVNPRPVPWGTLTGTVQKYLGPQVQLVSLDGWIKMLEGLDPYDAQSLAANSAVKILDFYRGFEVQRANGCLRYDTSHGTAASKTMANLAPVNIGWMEVWLRGLGYEIHSG
ncbi:hypothetical protein MMC30_008417 [Trapelia coarctata]|nr:hypothetical protein [Trapelia coarctata]